jgi:4-amino-4-deoxy-L-arabinose transferase-like glycosyltransferase
MSGVEERHDLPRWLCALYDALAALVLFAISYAQRAVAPLAVVSWDEPAWVLRSTRFLLALRSGDWAQTLQTGHPGVTTMWTGALSLNWHRLVTGRVSLAALESAAGIRFPEQVQDAAALRELAALLPYAKGGIWLVNALIVVAAYLLLRCLLPRRMAWVAGLALALSPYYTALSRLLHLDALAAGLMLLSLLAALAHLERRQTRAIALSGALAALATLTRSAGLFMAPVAAALIVWAAFRQPSEGRWRALLRSAGLWAAAALATVAMLWPAVWVDPLGAVKAVLNLSVQYATVEPGATATFFRGQVVEQAGPLFYPVALWFRTTPLAVLFGAVALLAALLPLPLARDGARRRLTMALAAFGLLLLAALTLATKKFDRYALPALLALDVLGGLGLALALDLVAERILRSGALRLAWRSLGVAVGGALLLGLGWLSEAAPLFPGHLLAYYNPLAGGLARAVETLPVGWGEGVPEAAAYLAALPDAEQLTVATWAAAGVAPTFPGQIVPLQEQDLPAADQVLVYIGDLQSGNAAAARYYGVRPARAVVRIQGVPLAWVFDNDDPELVAWIAATLTPHSVVLSNMDTALARAFPELPWTVAEGDLDAVAQGLQTAANGQASVVTLRYPWNKAAGRLIQRQLDQSALLVETRPFFLGEARRYVTIPGQLVGEVSARQPSEARWEGGLRLTAFGVSEQAQYRQAVGVALRFAPEQAQAGDWHLYARVVDAQGRVWGELDERQEDRAGLPTSDWLPGETYDCGLAVPLRAGIPWGEYRVVVGLYDLADMRRLVTVDASGAPTGAELTLGEVLVGPALIPAREDELGERTPLNIDLAGVALLGYRLDRESYATGERADLALFLQPRGPLNPEAHLAVGWRTAEGAVVWTAPQPLAGAGRKAADWRAGEPLELHYWAPIPETLAAGVHTLVINLVGADGPPVLPQDVALATVQVTRLERVYDPPTAQFTQRVTFGEVAALVGYDLGTPLAAPGDEVALTLHWQALAADPAGQNPRNLVVFVHLLDAAGAVRGQVDRQPAAGARPTSGWVAGEFIADAYAVKLDADAPPGDYRIEIGLYDPATMQRLPAVGEQGQRWPNDGVVLEATISVE